MTLSAALEAVADAGWEDLPGEPSRTAVVVGSCVGGARRLEDAVRAVAGADGCIDAFTNCAIMSSASPAAVAQRLGATGPALAVNTACASGGQAIGTAAALLAAGVADTAVACGAEACVNAWSARGFDLLGARTPSGRVRPFDVGRDGMAMGEGAAALVLEADDVARPRGARVLGEVAGFGSSCDAYHESNPRPDGRGLAAAIEVALAAAGVDAADVDHVNAHGTGTLANDASEAAALHAALDGHASAVPVSSAKAAVGHAFGGAGAMDAVWLLLALRAGVAPPTVNHARTDLDVRVAAEPVALRERRGRRRVGLSTNLGLGGHNAALCLAVEA
jgi:3-oxoacyl-[acyl-carrier-protein] synthase II